MKTGSCWFVVLCVFMTLVVSSCRKPKAVPPHIMAKDSLINILVDFHIIEGIIQYENSISPNTPKYATKYFSCYFEINDIDKARYDTSLLFYYNNPIDIANVVNANIVNRLSIIEAEIDKTIKGEKVKK